MNTRSTFSNRIDAAFGPLLMAKDILDQVIPNNDDETSCAMASQLAGELIKMAVQHLKGEAEADESRNVIDFPNQGQAPA